MAGFIHGARGIDHVFVLMLENRSFDHMLGFSGITGSDAETGNSTSIRGLKGTESNSFPGGTFAVTSAAPNSLPQDPPHEFEDVVTQLCGSGVTYSSGQPYPTVNMSGFVAADAKPGTGNDPSLVMKCFDTATKLPVLNALAREFAICDNWFASLPGPTWPNRMFVHGASSGGLDHSPSTFEIVGWEAVSGFSFPNGSVFDALAKKGIPRRLYAGDDFPMVAALKGIGLGDIRSYDNFAQDLQAAQYPYNYVFIEPSYDVLNEYKRGTSQHPRGDVTRGEALIKQTYEAIRNSPHWSNSVLIVTWDEHGGFFDHQVPPPAVPPGDTGPSSTHNKSGFTFAQHGVRVPAVVVSPRIARNVVDHRLYDHSSVPRTLELLFQFPSLTKRDAAANSLSALLTLDAPRDDAPTHLPNPAGAGAAAVEMAAAVSVADSGVTRAQDSVNEGNLPAVLQSALHQDLQASPDTERESILVRFANIKTRQQALDYLTEVQGKVRARR